jgi:predicted DNA-binding transcriptional regulator AlpA
VAKTSRAPSGFYTASEAMKKLGYASSTFYEYVDAGKIKKVIPPGKKEGYYLKAEIDKMIRAREAFILQYATDTTLFEKAQEEDIQGITELCIDLFGKNGTANYETRLAQYHSNPDIFYVLRQEDLIVGYIGMFPLKKEAIKTIMSGAEESRFRNGLLTPENILPFKTGQANDVFLVIGVRQGLPRSRVYGSRVISGAVEVMEQFARRDIIIKKLYGTSRTQDGIRIAKGMGFKQVTPLAEEDDLCRFVLDLETAKSPLFQKYQRIVKRVSSKAKERQQV